MNSSKTALIAALRLLGNSESDIGHEFLFKRQPCARAVDPFEPRAGEPGYMPGQVPEWAREQKQQDLLVLQDLAWERVHAEQQKVARLLARHPELNDNAEFREYLRTVEHVSDVVFGRLAFIPGAGPVTIYATLNRTGHRAGSWPEDAP